MQDLKTLKSYDPERILSAIERIDKAIQLTSNVRLVLDNVIHEVFQIFQSDRAWLFFPCNPDVPSFEVAFESTKPAYPGAKSLKESVPMTRDMAGYCHRALSQIGEPDVDPPPGHEMTNDIAIRFNVTSLMFMALHPQIGDPWMFGLHQCDLSRVWTDEDKMLFKTIGRRITDCIGNMLYLNQLRESEERYRKLVDTASDAIYLLSRDGKVLEANPAACFMLGRSKDEILALDIGGIDPNFTVEKFISFWEDAPLNNPMTFETTHKRLDGSLLPMEVCGQKFMMGEEIFFYGIARNISERKASDASLRESERKWRNILTNVPQIGISLDTEARIVFANAYFLNLTGWKEQEVLGRNWFDLFIPENVREEVRNVFHAVMGQEDTLGFSTYENEIMDRSKNLLNVAWSNVLTKDSNGKIVDVTCLGVDLTERRRTERKLKISETRYRTILKSAMDGFWATDTEGRLVEVNDAYCIMSGYSASELLNMRISDLEVIEDTDAVEAHMKKVIEKGRDRFESRHRRKGGTVFDVEVSIQFRPEEGGQCICFIRDITEQKKTFEAIKTANTRMKLAADSARFGIWDLNTMENRLEWDDWMFRLYGISRQNFGGAYEAWQAGVHPDDLARSSKEVEQALRGEKEFDTEFRIVRPDGEVRHMKANAIVSRDKKGNPVKMTGINYDITAQKKSQLELKESEARFRALHNASFGGIAIHDKGLILECNKGLSEITGYEYRELIGMDGLSLISDDTRQTVIQNIEEGYEKPYEVKGVRKNGETYPVRLEARNIPYKGKKVRVVEFRDITENKRAEKEREELEGRLRQAHRMESIGNLAGGVAHDFNNLLTPIIGLSELMLEDLPRDTLQSENIKEILKAGQRGSELVKQILAFSRQSEHKMVPTPLQNIIKEVLALSRSTIPSNIEIRQDIQADCGIAMADPTKIHQVAMNIITNAYHAVEESGGEITATLKELSSNGLDSSDIDLEPGQYAALSISDTGHGLPPDLMDKIFEPYFTTKKEGKGTGIGLSVAYGIVKEHGGTIKVESEIGKGSTFTVYLPLMEKSGGSEALEASETWTGGNEEILLVEDDNSVMNLEKQMLEKLGYRVKPFLNSIDALEAFKMSPFAFDLVLTDMSMPHMTGVQLARALMAVKPDLPIIICTGFSEKIDAKMITSLGIKGLLMKPIILAKLAQTVRKALDAAKAER